MGLPPSSAPRASARLSCRARLPPSNLEAIVATVVSSLAVAGSVVLVCVTGGGAVPLVFASLGFLDKAVRGVIHGGFSGAELAEETMVQTALALITFGAGFGASNCVGLALKGSNLSINMVRAVGSLAGAIAGAGARTGGSLVIRHVQGRVVETMNLVMEVVHDALGGAAAGFRGVEAVVMPVAVNDAGHAVVLQAFEEPTHVVRYDQTFLEAWEHPDIGHIGLIAGWQHLNGINGAGLLHIMYRHPDVFKPLGYSANDVGQAMLGGPRSDRFKELACAVRGSRCFLSPVLLYK